MLSEREFATVTTAYPVLQQMHAAARAALMAEGARFSAPDGAVLFDIEGSCAGFVLVTSGTIRVVKPALSGREIMLYRVLPGDNCILTVSCLLGHSDYPARGVAEGAVSGYVLARPLFNRLLAEESAFREFVFRYFAQRIVRLMALVEGVAFAQLDQRLAAALLAQCAEGEEIVRTTHQRLADEVGSVREVVSRTLKEFEQQGMVALERGQVRLRDRATLATLAFPAA